jgi:hypothetical protein
MSRKLVVTWNWLSLPSGTSGLRATNQLGRICLTVMFTRAGPKSVL